MLTPSQNAPGRPDFDADLKRLWDCLTSGGIAIIGGGIGYGVTGGTSDAVRRINEAKGRGKHKRDGVFMGYRGAREIFLFDQWKWDIIDCIVQDYNLPLGITGRFRPDHPLIQNIDPELLEMTTARNMIATALNEDSPLFDGLGELCYEHSQPVCGSSANLTGTGAKYRVQDIEEPIREIADLVIDHGLCKCHKERVGTTMINFETMELMRWGAYNAVIADLLKRHFGIDMPPDPGREVNLNGHVNEFALLEE